MADIEQPDTLTITLRKPVALGGVTYDHLALREPTGGEMLLWDELSGAAADIKAIATVSGVPEPAVKMIGVRDIRQGAAFLAGFLAAAPSTGES